MGQYSSLNYIIEINKYTRKLEDKIHECSTENYRIDIDDCSLEK